MFHSRFFRALAIVAGMAGMMYLTVSLVLPSSRRLVVGVDERSGKVRVVGDRATYLPANRFHRLSFEKRDGVAQWDGVVRVISKERVPVTIAYRLRFSVAGDHLPDARGLIRGGWRAWIGRRVGEAVLAVTQQMPIEEIVSPTSRFAARRDALRQTVARHLAESGLHVMAFELARIEPDRRPDIGHRSEPSQPRPGVRDEDWHGVRSVQSEGAIPPEQWGRYAYYNDLGIDLRREGKLVEATDAFQKAIGLNPSRPVPYLNLSMTLFDRRQYPEADAAFEAAVARGLPNGDRWFVDFAALYRRRNMVAQAIAVLDRGKKIFPHSWRIAANLGSALAQANRDQEGIPELERALALQPSSTLALNNLGISYAKRKDYARALDFWNRSLSIDPRQTAIRQAAAAARTQL